MVKVLIEVSGGLVKFMASSEDINFIIIDWDQLQAGDKVDDIDIIDPDVITHDFHSLFSRNREMDGAIRERLTELNF